jgi:hypothetical protein
LAEISITINLVPASAASAFCPSAQPAKEGCYTLADLKRIKPQSGLLFNTLFNLHKFLAFENRDPFALRAEALGEDSASTEWDRFARAEYLRLAVEEEPDDMQVDQAEEVWGAERAGAAAGGEGGKVLLLGEELEGMSAGPEGIGGGAGADDPTAPMDTVAMS